MMDICFVISIERVFASLRNGCTKITNGGKRFCRRHKDEINKEKMKTNETAHKKANCFSKPTSKREISTSAPSQKRQLGLEVGYMTSVLFLQKRIIIFP